MTLHLSVCIAWALAMSDRELVRVLSIQTPRHRYTAREIRLHLRRQQAKGRSYLPLACPAPAPDGSCPGHQPEPSPATGKFAG